jgi:hypothetical protein
MGRLLWLGRTSRHRPTRRSAVHPKAERTLVGTSPQPEDAVRADDTPAAGRDSRRIAGPCRHHQQPLGGAMNKPTSIAFGLVGALCFLASALRPELARDAVRFARWQYRAR